ncbi:ATP-dependent helicase HrpB [Steroidobacter agaridevorans]|uniref:ATP-dependent helicase HrpB n=1 Tax=Steroidobacter agaridevorans TaxID=2695856 RepID=A0A829Y8K4_9GAMM|nr:ATP-dependent helicase HrpB [Steroidobacter agaridevorans]GFE78922.1 ATP-dependent helicase HrpB [Steroidobacter agaridevorans]
MNRSVALPIEAALPDLRCALAEHRNVVLQAPPGAGKSTGVPLALLPERWRGDARIVMLEPRRLAARAVATRMAQTLGEPVGRTVGFRTRLETKVTKDTRIEVVTEGILTRWLQRDPTLEGVALVIFDEFHERSLNADLGLALCLDAQETVREDLRLLVMSATLDGAAVAKLLGDAPIVTAEGRAFPVTTHYRERLDVRSARPQYEDMAQIVARTISRAIEDEPGDVLAFLPGQGEIRRAQRFLEETSLPPGVRVLPLFGELAPHEQDAAIQPSRSGERKIVLATNIAETSLTIEGVRIVVDSGQERRSRFDPVTGMSRLELGNISRASADQRRGRAGRIQAGVCYRLWSEVEHSSLPAQTAPEIVGADLAPLALELTNWGIADPGALRWLDPPPSATFAQARDLLRSLDAIAADGRVTEHGRALARMSTHPRLAHMIVRGTEMGLRTTSLQIAAVLGERDLLRTQGQDRNVDLRFRVEALRGERSLPAGVSIDQGAKQRALRSIDLLARQLEQPRHDNTKLGDFDVGRLLALAYPDRIAQSRGAGGRYLLSNGRGAQLPPAQSLSQAAFLVVADLDAGDREAMIRLAAPLTRELLEADFASHIEHRERFEWDSREQSVAAQDERWFGALKLYERRIDKPDPARMLDAMLAGVRELGLAALPWTKPARALQTRLIFAKRFDERAPAPWPDVSDTALMEHLDDWLAPWLTDMSRRDHLARLDLHGILMSLLDWNAQQRLETFAPTHLPVPSGSRIPIDYTEESPTVAVRLQEVFGMHETPTVAEGRVPLTLQLLSPAHRPVQVTRDLVSFWARGYLDVKKELKGRYPKHYWPDDPLTAQATARAKPRPR